MKLMNNVSSSFLHEILFQFGLGHFLKYGFEPQLTYYLYDQGFFPFLSGPPSPQISSELLVSLQWLTDYQWRVFTGSILLGLLILGYLLIRKINPIPNARLCLLFIGQFILIILFYWLLFKGLGNIPDRFVAMHCPDNKCPPGALCDCPHYIPISPNDQIQILYQWYLLPLYGLFFLSFVAQYFILVAWPKIKGKRENVRKMG